MVSSEGPVGRSVLTRKIAELCADNAQLRKQVIKGRDIAKLLANKYSEKLAAVQRQHAEDLAQAQQRQMPDAAGLQELREQVADLEQAVTMYVGLAHERERELNEQLASLALLTRQQAAHIAAMEKEEEELDARLVVMEGRVRGVVKEARGWNAREKEVVERLKEESLLVVHLAQREQQMLNEQREWAARVERAEKKTRELEEELLQVQQYHAARDRLGDKGDGDGSRKSFHEDAVMRRGSTLSGLSSPVLSPSLSSNSDKGTPPVPPRSSSRRGARSHQRSESLGVTMLQLMRDSEAASSHPVILVNDVPPPMFSSGSVSGHTSPRAEQHVASHHLQQLHQLPPPPPLRMLEETKASRGSHAVLRATAPNVNNDGARGSARRKSYSKSELESSVLAANGGNGAAGPSAGQEAPLPQVPATTSSSLLGASVLGTEDGKETRRQRRGTRKMVRPPSSDAMDGVSAEVLASVEAEIALLLKK